MLLKIPLLSVFTGGAVHVNKIRVKTINLQDVANCDVRFRNEFFGGLGIRLVPIQACYSPAESCHDRELCPDAAAEIKESAAFRQFARTSNPGQEVPEREWMPGVPNTVVRDREKIPTCFQAVKGRVESFTLHID